MSNYPETKPEGQGQIENFMFSISASNHATDDIRLRREALETRMHKIADKCLVTIQGQRVSLLDSILNFGINKDELKTLAAGLDRVAELYDDLMKLKAQEKVLEMAKADPKFFAWAFGDFDAAIDDIDTYLKNELTNEG